MNKLTLGINGRGSITLAEPRAVPLRPMLLNDYVRMLRQNRGDDLRLQQILDERRDQTEFQNER